jgi:hypothetical protein
VLNKKERSYHFICQYWLQSRCIIFLFKKTCTELCKLFLSASLGSATLIRCTCHFLWFQSIGSNVWWMNSKSLSTEQGDDNQKLTLSYINLVVFIISHLQVLASHRSPCCEWAECSRQAKQKGGKLQPWDTAGSAGVLNYKFPEQTGEFPLQKGQKNVCIFISLLYIYSVISNLYSANSIIHPVHGMQFVSRILAFLKNINQAY